MATATNKQKDKNMNTIIANQAQIVKNIKQLFSAPRRQQERSPLTPTQRFIVSDLKGLILQKDGNGKAATFAHWELRKLKGSRTVLLASVVGKTERYILIGPRGHLQQLSNKSDMNQMELDQAITALVDADAEGNA